LRRLLPLLLLGGVAEAVPPRGAQLAPVTLADADGHARTLPDGRGPLLLFYEDRHVGAGNTENHRLHRLLFDAMERPENRGRLEVVPVGDVESFDFWPARRIATGIIRERGKRERYTILCDWRGAVRRTWGLTRGKSGNLLLAADGRVLFAAEGPLDEAQVRDLLARLTELGVTVPPLDPPRASMNAKN
jgi:hypothetical protein